MGRVCLFAAFVFAVLSTAAHAQDAPILIAQVNGNAGATNCGGVFPPTTGTKFKIGFDKGPFIFSALLPSPLAISNTTIQLDRNNTPGFDDVVALLTDGVSEQLQTGFFGAVEPGTPYGEGIGSTGGSPEAARLGRTRDLHGFDIAFIRLVIAHAIASFTTGPCGGDGFSFDVQATWEIWGVPVNNHPPIVDAGPDQMLVAAGSYATAVGLSGNGTDSDADPLTFAWTGAFGTVSGRNPTIALLPGVYDITLTVSDDRFASASDTVRITVRDAIAELSTQIANQCSQAGGGADISVALGGLTTQVAQCQQVISVGQMQLAAKDGQLAVQQTQLNNANQQIASLTQQLALFGAAINSLERDYQRLVPTFHFPGATDIDRLNSLIGALLAERKAGKKDVIDAIMNPAN